MPRVVHFEIHASNPVAVIPFYEALLGWTFTPWGPPGSYWLVGTGEEGPGINGGLLPRRGAKPVEGQAVNAFVCTVEVPDVRGYFAKALECGGTEALPVQAIPGVGWLGYVKDPDGNILGMMQNDPTAR